MTAEHILRTLEQTRIRVSTEALAQLDIATALQNAGVVFEAEVILTQKDRIDFMVGSIGIEVKVASSKREILRQITRYAESDRISHLILATSRSFPSDGFELNGKPVLICNLHRGWL